MLIKKTNWDKRNKLNKLFIKIGASLIKTRNSSEHFSKKFEVYKFSIWILEYEFSIYKN